MTRFFSFEAAKAAKKALTSDTTLSFVTGGLTAHLYYGSQAAYNTRFYQNQDPIQAPKKNNSPPPEYDTHSTVLTMAP